MDTAHIGMQVHSTVSVKSTSGMIRNAQEERAWQGYEQKYIITSPTASILHDNI